MASEGVLETAGSQAEPQFAALVDALAADPEGRNRLIDLLREDHPVYDQRGAAATVRMRGWILLALARIGLSDAGLVFVLEELDTGADAYLVAASARALRSYSSPLPAFGPFLMRALMNFRYRDDRVTFEGYGEYAVSSSGTSPVRELLATLAWLGPKARGILSDLESLRAQPGGLSRKMLAEVDRTIEAVRGQAGAVEEGCCALPASLSKAFFGVPSFRLGSAPVDTVAFEDHDGESIAFNNFFKGHPTVAVFFYTRCDNPLKCSLTIAKLARIQKLLEERGLKSAIRTAAITYDPAFDLSQRLRGYGQDRGLRLDSDHRMLRTVDGIDALRRHFRLGVNFIGSLVNRHRIELFILDSEGRIAATFERIRWDEAEVVDRAVEVLREPAKVPASRYAASTAIGTLASTGLAFFPKCPVCWTAYLSMFGIAGIEQTPSISWLQPMLIALMLVNVASVWLRSRSTGRMAGFYLVCAGAIAVAVSKAGLGWEHVALWGVALTLAGSVLSALNAGRTRAPKEL